MSCKQFEARVPMRQPNSIDVQVGNRLYIQRMLIGMSQGGLGALLGLTFQQIQKYEKGINRISAGRLFEIARILNVPINFFYEGVSAAPCQSGCHEKDSFQILEFIFRGEGLQLSLAFMKIKDVKVRRRVLDLLESLAEDETQKLGEAI